MRAAMTTLSSGSKKRKNNHKDYQNEHQETRTPSDNHLFVIQELNSFCASYQELFSLIENIVKSVSQSRETTVIGTTGIYLVSKNNTNPTTSSSSNHDIKQRSTKLTGCTTGSTTTTAATNETSTSTFTSGIKKNSSTTATTTTTSSFVSSASLRSCFPSELIHSIAAYLVVQPVQHEEVNVLSVSSTNGQHDIKAVLIDDNGATWWMSSNSTATENILSVNNTTSLPRQQLPGFHSNGQGMEWIDLLVTPDPSPLMFIPSALPSRTTGFPKRRVSCRRISSISISIPPLPMGPLSVRTFRIDIPKKQHSDNYECCCSNGASRKENSMVSNSGTTTTTTSTTTASSTTAATSTKSSCSSCWVTVSPIYNVSNRTGFQEFRLPKPIDCRILRVVCLSNQISRFFIREIQGEEGRQTQSNEEVDQQGNNNNFNNDDQNHNDNDNNIHHQQQQLLGEGNIDNRNQMHLFNSVGIYSIKLR